MVFFQIGEQNAAIGHSKNINLAAPADRTEPILVNKRPVLVEIESFRTVPGKSSFGLAAPSPERDPERSIPSLRRSGLRVARMQVRQATVGLVGPLLRAPYKGV